MENAMQTIVSETDIHQAAYMISEEKSIFEPKWIFIVDKEKISYLKFW